jgi:hypothetical protein
MTLVITNCADSQKNSVLEKKIEIIDQVDPTPQPKEPEHVWVYDPEPWAAPQDTEKPNILSIGDSISVGYLAALSRNMPEYDIMHPNDNCRNSFYTLENIDSWLALFPNNDMILWNNGVWDTTADYWPRQYSTAPIEWYGTTTAQYESNLIQIARKLKATGSRVIFLTTTHILGPPFNLGYELELNAIAKRVLPLEGVEIFDLYAVSLPLKDARPNQWDVHFNREANQVFADEINKYIRGI